MDTHSCGFANPFETGVVTEESVEIISKSFKQKEREKDASWATAMLCVSNWCYRCFDNLVEHFSYRERSECSNFLLK